jgi:hypothetical protein
MLFFHAQKIALIESMNPQCQDLRSVKDGQKRAGVLREARVE